MSLPNDHDAIIEEKKPMERNLGDHLREIFLNASKAARTAAEERKRIEEQKLEKRAIEMLDNLLPEMEQAARSGCRYFILQRPVSCTAMHNPPAQTTLKNICMPDQLTGLSAVLYRRCLDLNLKVVEIRYFQEHDSDEPGAYIGGYELVAVW